MQEDLYYPYTEGPQKFRLYRHPTLVDITPTETEVTKLQEVYITASEADPFWQPIPSAGDNEINNDQYGIKCKFGRFGSSTGTYVNQTTILCLTPNIQDDPEDISTETVQVTVAMNGVDYNDDSSEVDFTFIGTGGVVPVWVIVMGTLIFGLLIVAMVVCLSSVQRSLTSFTQVTEGGDLGPKRSGGASRGSSRLGGSRAAGPSRGAGSGSRQGGSRAGGGSRSGLRFGGLTGNQNPSR